MRNPVVRIDTRRITGPPSFHDVFAEAMGFPSVYGRNMNAWIDCMTSLDAPADGMTSVYAPLGGVLVLQLDHVDDFAARCPGQYTALLECMAFVNWRRIDVGEEGVLALSFHRTSAQAGDPK